MGEFKSGFVAMIGRTNVGKSTLMNRLIGQKIAITSNKPQTTRTRIRTILTEERGQAIFVDTPGIHKAQNKLGEFMVEVAQRTLSEVDLVLWLIEPVKFIGAGDKRVAEMISSSCEPETKKVLVINKIDTITKEELAGRFISISLERNVSPMQVLSPIRNSMLRRLQRRLDLNMSLTDLRSLRDDCVQLVHSLPVRE